MFQLASVAMLSSCVVGAGVGFGVSRFLKGLSKRSQKNLNEAPLVRQEITTCLTGMHDHMTRVMGSAEVIEEPFPHLIVENFLPEEIYQHACALWPAAEEFVGAKNSKRRILPITYGCLEDTTLPKNQKVFWRIFGEVIINRYLKPKLAEKFKPYLYQKLNLGEHFHSFDPNLDTCNLRQDCLIIDQDSPNMPPHVDQLNMLAQIMIYFPTDDQHQEMGTTFYQGDPNTTPNSLYEIKDPTNIKLVKKAKYRPNTLVVFIQSPVAWHGYERPEHADPSYQRRVFLSPLFFSPEFMERHYQGIYSRSIIDEYFFDHRFLQKKNWINIWADED